MIKQTKQLPLLLKNGQQLCRCINVDTVPCPVFDVFLANKEQNTVKIPVSILNRSVIVFPHYIALLASIHFHIYKDICSL